MSYVQLGFHRLLFYGCEKLKSNSNIRDNRLIVHRLVQ